jgi:hypothetical protein
MEGWWGGAQTYSPGIRRPHGDFSPSLVQSWRRIREKKAGAEQKGRELHTLPGLGILKEGGLHNEVCLQDWMKILGSASIAPEHMPR